MFNLTLEKYPHFKEKNQIEQPSPEDFHNNSPLVVL